MSADNIVYVVRERGVWHVAHCSASDGFTSRDRLNSTSFSVYTDALEFAHEMQSYLHTEYGVCVVERDVVSLDDAIRNLRDPMSPLVSDAEQYIRASTAALALACEDAVEMVHDAWAREGQQPDTDHSARLKRIGEVLKRYGAK